MSPFTLFLFLFWSISLIGEGQDSTHYQFNIGNSEIQVEEYCFKPCRKSVVFIHLHDDEKTSLDVAKDFLSSMGGRLVRLKNNQQRNVEISMFDEPLCFDPNRIYSRDGARESLKAQSDTDINESAVNELYNFSAELLDFIKGSKLIVSLHNNTDSNYSIFQVQDDLWAKKYAGKIHVNIDMDQDDFILTTDSTVYNLLVQKNINVILEDATGIEDDGSLSLYAGKRGIPYINIEAQHGHKIEQLMLLDALKDVISAYE